MESEQGERLALEGRAHIRHYLRHTPRCPVAVVVKRCG